MRPKSRILEQSTNTVVSTLSTQPDHIPPKAHHQRAHSALKNGSTPYRGAVGSRLLFQKDLENSKQAASGYVKADSYKTANA